MDMVLMNEIEGDVRGMLRRGNIRLWNYHRLRVAYQTSLDVPETYRFKDRYAGSTQRGSLGGTSMTCMSPWA